MIAIRIGRGWGGGSGGVDVEEVTRPEIKCRQYLSSMAKCAHVLSAPFFPTPGVMSLSLLTMDFLFLCSTPPRRLLWLHHAVRSSVGRWSSNLRATVTINGLSITNQSSIVKVLNSRKVMTDHICSCCRLIIEIGVRSKPVT